MKSFTFQIVYLWWKKFIQVCFLIVVYIILYLNFKYEKKFWIDIMLKISEHLPHHPKDILIHFFQSQQPFEPYWPKFQQIFQLWKLTSKNHKLSRRQCPRNHHLNEIMKKTKYWYPNKGLEKGWIFFTPLKVIISSRVN